VANRPAHPQIGLSKRVNCHWNPRRAVLIYPGLRWETKVPPSAAHQLRRQVSTLSEFGKRALRSDDIDGRLQEATRLVSDAIDVELVKVLELVPGSENLLPSPGELEPRRGGPRHNTCARGLVGWLCLAHEPACDHRRYREGGSFAIPELLIEHSVRSTVNVVIRGEDGPFGVLEVASRQLRKFEQDGIDFLQNYANLLASAIDRVRIQRELAERALRQEMLGHELQHRINNLLTTIQAVARRTCAKSKSLDEFAKALTTD
jgi:transcriptional regulator with GAF, ATPase, and Fis domain